MNKSDEELRKELDPELYRVARQGGTEAPGSGKHTYSKESGMYECAVCGNQLFSSDTKFDTKIPGLIGWPSFDEALPGSIRFEVDDSAGMSRTKVLCANCGSHLGHVFDDDSETKTGKHYCINSVCLNLQEK